MATRRLPSPVTGKLVEATVVDIVEIEDKPIMIRLADGSLLRLKVDVVEVVRFEERDKEGNPFYNVRSGNSMIVLESGEK